MKRVAYSMIAVVTAVLISAAGLYAEEIKPAGFASADVMSRYVWRGQVLSNSWVVQPSVGITYGAFGASIWANYDSDSTVDEGSGSSDSHSEVTETDITLSYTRTIDKWTFGAGYIYYAFSGAPDTQEAYLSVSYNTLLNPTLTAYWDFDEGQGGFVIASISHVFDLGKGLGLKLGASASYNINNKVMGFDKNGDDFSNFYTGEVSAALTVPITKYLSVTPKVAYSFSLSDDATDALNTISNDGRQDIFYGGVNLTLSF